MPDFAELAGRGGADALGRAEQVNELRKADFDRLKLAA
jgi:hypothetical protein